MPMHPRESLTPSCWTSTIRPNISFNAGNKSFYTAEGLAAVRNQLKPGGCFALWSNDPASEDFTKHLEAVFGSATAHNVEFPNPYTGSISVNSVYTAQKIGN